jgi:hypothetical protein
MSVGVGNKLNIAILDKVGGNTWYVDDVTLHLYDNRGLDRRLMKMDTALESTLSTVGILSHEDYGNQALHGQIETVDGVVDALVVSLTGAITTEPTAKSLRDILHKDGNRTFNNATDSLEGIRDAVDDIHTDVGTADGVIDAVKLVVDDLHVDVADVHTDLDNVHTDVGSVLSAITAAVPNPPTAGSLQDILSKSTNGYNKATDSLESISDSIADIHTDVAAVRTAQNWTTAAFSLLLTGSEYNIVGGGSNSMAQFITPVQLYFPSGAFDNSEEITLRLYHNINSDFYLAKTQVINLASFTSNQRVMFFPSLATNLDIPLVLATYKSLRVSIQQTVQTQPGGGFMTIYYQWGYYKVY